MNLRGFLREAANRPVLCCLVLSPILLSVQAFVGLHTAVYQGDCSPIFLMEARRMLAGEVIYRDFFEQAFPGTTLVYLGLFRVFGIRAWIPDLAWVLLGTGLACVVVAIAKRIVDGPLALLPGVLFLAFAFSTEPDPTHHWYATLAAMGALALLIRKRTSWRIAAAGALCGLSACFTQPRGASAALGIALFLLWEAYVKKQPWKELLWREVRLMGSSLAVVIPTAAYFLAKAGIRRFLFCTIVFPMKYFNKHYWNTPQVYLSEVPLQAGWVRIPAVCIWVSMHLLVPAIYLVLLVRGWQQAQGQQEDAWDPFMLLSLFGLSLFAGVAYSASWLRLCSVSLPAMILLVWLIRRSGRLQRVARIVLWSAALAILMFQGFTTQLDGRGFLDSPLGRITFDDSARYAKFQWLANHTDPGDWLFEADDSDVYYPLDLRNPSGAPFLTSSAFTRPDQVQDAKDALERYRVRFVLWSVWLDVPKPRPGHNPDPTFNGAQLEPLRAYLREQYHPIAAFTDDAFQQVWERNGSEDGSPRRFALGSVTQRAGYADNLRGP